MADEELFATDRIIIKLDLGQPMELTHLTDSFAALARLYERHYRSKGEGAPKLFITRLETGSIIAEIAPYATLLGAIILTMDSAIIVADFTTRISHAIRAFSGGVWTGPPPKIDSPDSSDAADIREFLRPLAGKRGASLGVRHARMEKRDGAKVTVIEYKFDETEINRAVINIDEALAGDTKVISLVAEGIEHSGPIKREVMLFFEQANRKPGKESGRTGDRGIVPDVSDKPLPIYFRESFQNLKDLMVRGITNPLNSTFVVDVHVQYVEGEPKGYIVTNIHKVIDSGDSEEQET